MERNSPEYQAYLQILERSWCHHRLRTGSHAIACGIERRRCWAGCPRRWTSVSAAASSKMPKAPRCLAPGAQGHSNGGGGGPVRGPCRERSWRSLPASRPKRWKRFARCEEQLPVEIGLTDGENLFEILLSAFAGMVARVHLVGGHTQLVLVEKRRKAIYRYPEKACGGGSRGRLQPPFGGGYHRLLPTRPPPKTWPPWPAGD